VARHCTLNLLTEFWCRRQNHISNLSYAAEFDTKACHPADKEALELEYSVQIHRSL